jgi:hypothetical protein
MPHFAIYIVRHHVKITDKMKIIINRNSLSERQSAIVTVDTKHCHYPYAIRESIELAMELDGYTKETIDEVFGRRMAETCVKSDEE